jgi:hypothetical protein
MKVDIILDHQSILENRRSTIFFAARLQCEPSPVTTEPAAYALIIDANNPSDLVLRLAENIIRHLPSNAEVSIFNAAEPGEPIYSLGDVSDKESLIALVSRIDPAISENLSALWPLGCRELKKSSAAQRKIIYLTHDPDIERLLSLPTAAAAQEGIVTSILAARPGPAENVLQHLARAGGGILRKNFSYDELNAITAAELGGLLRPAARNVRLRLKALDFCEGIEALGAHRDFQNEGKDGWSEFMLGDCLAGEDRTICFNLEVQPLPCVDCQPITSLEDEPLVELAIEYDEISPESVLPRSFRRTVRVEAQARPGAEKNEVFERRSLAAPSPFGRRED